MSADDVPRSLDFSLPVSRSLPSLRDGDDDDVLPMQQLTVELPVGSPRDDDGADRPALGSGALRTPRELPRTFLRVSQHGSAEGIAKEKREEGASRDASTSDGHMSALSLLNIHSDVHLADSVAAAARRTERIVHEFASRHGSGSPAALRVAPPRSPAQTPHAARTASPMTSWSAALAPSSPAIVRAETLGMPTTSAARSDVLEGVPSKREFERALATVRRGLGTHVGHDAQLAVLMPASASQLAAADAQLPVMVRAAPQSSLAPVVAMTPAAAASPAVAEPSRSRGIAAATARTLAAFDDAGAPATPQAAARPARAPDSAYRQLLNSIDSMLATERARGFTSRPSLARGTHARVSELAADDAGRPAPASPGTIITATIERAAAAVRAQAPRPATAPAPASPAPASPALSAYNLGPASPARFRPPTGNENERQAPASLAPKTSDAPATPSVRSAASNEARAILGESPTARRRNRQAPRQRVMF